MSIQGSAEWLAERLGRVGASRVADVIARTKTGWGASRANYMAELIAERLTGVPAEKYTNAAMQWGTDNEADARIAYEFRSGQRVVEVGFIHHPTVAMSGASPDGLVGEDGLVEIKCPGTAQHLDTLLGEKIADKYVTQMQWQMACTGRAWCDFVSFDPRLPEHLRVKIKRVKRDADNIATLEKLVAEFLAEIDEKMDRLRRHGQPGQVKEKLEQSVLMEG